MGPPTHTHPLLLPPPQSRARPPDSLAHPDPTVLTADKRPAMSSISTGLGGQDAAATAARQRPPSPPLPASRLSPHAQQVLTVNMSSGESCGARGNKLGNKVRAGHVDSPSNLDWPGPSLDRPQLGQWLPSNAPCAISTASFLRIVPSHSARGRSRVGAMLPKPASGPAMPGRETPYAASVHGIRWPERIPSKA